MSRHFSGVSFPSDKGVTVTRGIKSITIPDGVSGAPVIGTITILGGVSHCRATCERQRLLCVWDCARAPYVPTQCNQPLEVANARGSDATPITVKPYIAPSHGRGNRAQPENLMLPKIPEAAQWWS